MTVEATTVASDVALFYRGSVRADPYPALARLRAASPCRVGDTPFVVVAGHADCTALLRDPRASVDRRLAAAPINLLDSHRRTLPADAPPPLVERSFLWLDPPDHTRLRRLVSSAFTPRVVQRLEHRIDSFVDAAIDRAAVVGSFDAVSDLAYPLPVTVICDLLGVPIEDVPLFQSWSSIISSAIDPISAATSDPAAAIAEVALAQTDLQHYLDGLLDLRRRAPRDDLLSALLAAEDDGDTLSHDELVATAGLLLIAGHETTVNLIANGILALLRHPGVAESLRLDPALGAGIVEETLRFDPPVQTAGRIAREPITVGDLDIRPGDVIGLLLAAANRDPKVYDDPDRFDPRRRPRHLAFGLGTHFCLGASLARLECRIALTRFAQRFRHPVLVQDPPVYRPNISLRGPDSLEIRFDDIVAAGR